MSIPAFRRRALYLRATSLPPANAPLDMDAVGEIIFDLCISTPDGRLARRLRDLRDDAEELEFVMILAETDGVATRGQFEAWAKNRYCGKDNP